MDSIAVAPYMGAWIETNDSDFASQVLAVAPYMGAWIETQLKYLIYGMSKSHPTWVRGLKLNRSTNTTKISRSHPTWVRGLKLLILLVLMVFLRRTLHGCVD